MPKLTDYKFIDIHYHASPDLFVRRHNANKAGKIYQSLDGAVILNSHLGATSVQATLAQESGLPVFPSLVLNHIAGGIDYRVIMRALNEYQSSISAKMIVHFPTITGRTIQSRLIRQFSHPYLSQHAQKSETLFNEHQQLRQEVIDILKMANDYPIVLSTGHASAAETYRLVDACLQYNIPALLLNQPANPLTGLNATALDELSSNECVWVEQTALTYLLGHQSKEDFIEVLTHTPKVLYSSDLGQTSQMDIADWYQYTNSLFAEFNLTEQRQQDVLKLNAIKMLSM